MLTTQGGIIKFRVSMKIYSTTNVIQEGLNCYDTDCTSFIMACHEGNEAKVDRLLKNNNEVQKKINRLANCGMNGLMIACLKGYTEIVSLILKKETSWLLNTTDKKKGQSALTMAVIKGHLEIVKLLTQEESTYIDLNIPDYASKTPFMHACQNGFIEIVQYFLKLAKSRKSKDFRIIPLYTDLDLNATADNGNTAFHYACHAEKEDVVDLLIGSAGQLKIDLQRKNYDGITGYDLWPEKFERSALPGPAAPTPAAPSPAAPSPAAPAPAPAAPAPAPAAPAPAPAAPAPRSPIRSPARSPTRSPERSPMVSPTRSPLWSPTRSPLWSPTRSPTRSMSPTRTRSPIRSRSPMSSHSPIRSPTRSPTMSRNYRHLDYLQNPIRDFFQEVINRRARQRGNRGGNQGGNRRGHRRDHDQEYRRDRRYHRRDRR